jgi:hypothetical protein
MADKKISALTAATTPLAGTEVLPIVQSGTTVKVAVSDLTAGRAIAATSVTTAAVQASNSGGLALKNSGGTTQMTLGGGGGDNITLSVATNITPANAAVAISPTGTGTVAISPAGALTVNPTTASTINNTSIGATTASTGRFTSVTATTGDVVVSTLNKGLNLPYAAVKSSNTSGDFTITVSGLSTLSSSVWRKSSMLVYYSGIDGAITNGTDLLTIVEFGGLSTYAAAVLANIVGTATITSANASTTGIEVTFDISNSNAGSVMVFLLGGAEGSSPQIDITP